MPLHLPATPSGLVQLPLQPQQASQTGSSKHSAAGLVAATRHTYTLRRTSSLQHPSNSQHSSPALPAHPCDSNRQFVSYHCITWRGVRRNPGHNFGEKNWAHSAWYCHITMLHCSYCNWHIFEIAIAIFRLPNLNAKHAQPGVPPVPPLPNLSIRTITSLTLLHLPKDAMPLIWALHAKAG